MNQCELNRTQKQTILTYKHSLVYNPKSHKYRNKHKLGKQLEVEQKISIGKS